MDANKAYSLLGLREGASEDEIKSAYRALAKRYDPEQYEAGPLREDAQARMNEINEAFDTLMSLIRTGGDPHTEYSAPASSQAQNSIANGRYRNIRQLADNGEILTLETEDTRSHYDGNTTPHWHFVCGVCGRILDLFFAVEAPPELLDRGFLVESEKCIYYGTCPDCAKKR